MKRKILAAILSVAMTATLLTGCGGASAASGSSTDSTASADSEASADGVQEISWMFWDDLNATEDLITKGYAEVIDRFNKDYEGV